MSQSSLLRPRAGRRLDALFRPYAAAGTMPAFARYSLVLARVDDRFFSVRYPDLQPDGNNPRVPQIRQFATSLLQAAVRSKLVRQSCYNSVQADRSPPRPKTPSWRRHTPNINSTPPSPTSSTASAVPTASPCCLFSPPPATTSPFHQGASAVTPPPYTPLSRSFL